MRLAVAAACRAIRSRASKCMPAAPCAPQEQAVTFSGRLQRLIDDPAGWRYQLVDATPARLAAGHAPRSASRRAFLASGAALGLAACAPGRFAGYTEKPDAADTQTDAADTGIAQTSDSRIRLAHCRHADHGHAQSRRPRDRVARSGDRRKSSVSSPRGADARRRHERHLPCDRHRHNRHACHCRPQAFRSLANASGWRTVCARPGRIRTRTSS